ncbi:dephospho-CoA kinase [Chitinivibrio alkaliphilus]|uniref:Dephospho-CoA kinase n=1 Tax=Chitinivibrio alkaliphilus ACht1 TaxID=1313304 RepID=U7D797_9BACT|nr:dephospho-CoA kinase [Chitinivibrio alkaliphilus]ERP30967.1 dephospho-CoA kinase [Chitinivibrio alkaliphilus ACht1]
MESRRSQVWGIAGYMGSGKTTAAQILAARHGALHLEADHIAKQCMMESSSIQRALKKEFDVVEGTTIHFSRLGEIVFANEVALLRLNEIVHPLLRERMQTQISQASKKVVIVDAAVLPLWEGLFLCDQYVWVTAPRTIRIARILSGTQRDPVKTDQRVRMQEQLFAPPRQDSPWVYCDNSSTMEALEKELFRVERGFSYCE